METFSKLQVGVLQHVTSLEEMSSKILSKTCVADYHGLALVKKGFTFHSKFSIIYNMKTIKEILLCTLSGAIFAAIFYYGLCLSVPV
jgi:hypothetical protein